MRLLLLIVLILLVIGALPAWPYSAGWGYYPVGRVGPAGGDPGRRPAVG